MNGGIYDSLVKEETKTKNMRKYCTLLFAVLLIFLLTACSEPVDTVAIPELQFAANPEEIQTPEMKSSLSFDEDTLTAFYYEVPDVETMIKEYYSVSEIVNGEVELINNTDGYWLYKAGDGTLLIDMNAGTWTYSTPIPSSAPENLPSDIDAQEIATTAISNSGLDIGLVKDMGTVSYITDSNNEPIQKNVIYYPVVDGRGTYGIFRTTVGIGEGGKIVYFSKQSFGLKELGEVRLKNADEVRADLNSGKFISNAAGASGTATITDYELCYYCDGVVKDGKLYVQPVYVFSAEIDSDTGEAEHFKVFVDAASQG